MKTKFIEATEATQFNWGKFMVCRFEAEEWARRSEIATHERSLLHGRGWTPNNVLVVDLQTGEGAIFKPGGYVKYDLNDKHQIWVCPMFEPFLEWLYKQDLTDLDTLPGHVNLGDVPIAMQGYRRQRKKSKKSNLSEAA
jgi:hypothetical protein